MNENDRRRPTSLTPILGNTSLSHYLVRLMSDNDLFPTISVYSPIRDAIATDVAYARQGRRVLSLLTERDDGGGYWL